MAALRIHDYAVCIMIFYKMVIKYLSKIGTYAYGTSTHTLTSFRKIIFEPIHHIHIVNMLFDDMIPAQPVEIVPVSHLIFHLILTRFTLPYPYPFTVPIYLCRSDIADHSILIPF